MASNGIVALLLYCFLLGAPFARFIGDNEESISFLLVSISTSLWISWIVLYIAYLTGSTPPFFTLLLSSIFLLTVYYCRNDSTIKYNYLLLSVAVLFLCFSIILCSQYRQYTPIFSEWDAVVSWNRWAIELFSGKYVPQKAAYPIFWPALWALIYHAQGSDNVWILSKFSLLVCPLILLLSLFDFIRRSNTLQSYFAFFIATLFFIFLLAKDIATGYMDAPVAILSFVCLLGIFSIINDRKLKKTISYDKLVFTSCIVGITSITKQAGVISLLFFLSILIYLYFTNYIKIKSFIAFLCITSFPFFSFLFLFYKNTKNSSAVGNLDKLIELTSRSGDKLSNAYIALINMFSGIMRIPGWIIFYSILFFCLLNVFQLRKQNGKFGLLNLLISFIGFFIWAFTTSYHPRNGWWIVGYLIMSAACGLSIYKSPIIVFKKHYDLPLNNKYLIVLCVLSFLPFLYIDINATTLTKRLNDVQYECQTKLGSKEVAVVLKSLLDNNHKQITVYTDIQLLRYNPLLTQYYQMDKIKWNSYPKLMQRYLDENNSCLNEIWVLTNAGADDMSKLIELVNSREIIKHPSLHIYYVKMDSKENLFVPDTNDKASNSQQAVQFVVANNYSDSEWKNGVLQRDGRSNNFYFIQHESVPMNIKVGDTLNFAKTGMVIVQKIHQLAPNEKGNFCIYVTVDKDIDPVRDGYPNKIFIGN